MSDAGLLPRPWRAWHTFQTSLVGAFLVLVTTMAIAAVLRLRHGELDADETGDLLGLLYWGTYPLTFLALGALAWHFVRSYRGDYAA